MDKVKISIIIPVYNAENYLDSCLSSILVQKMTSYEVILVDDGSTDSSSLICDRYSATDSRFRTIHKKNGGVSSARNAGMALAQGEYVMFVDSDDRIAPDSLTVMADAAKQDPDFILGGFDIYQDDIPYGSVLPSVSGFFASLSAFYDGTVLDFGELYRGPWAKLYRRALIKKHSLTFDESLSYAEDKLFVYKFLDYVTSAAAAGTAVYEYYRRPGTLSGGKTTLRRLSQLLDVVPLCAESLCRLIRKYPDCTSLQKIYHNDIVCCDLMRILRSFLKIRTERLSDATLAEIYALLDKDVRLRVFERQVPGQIVNTILYKIGNPCMNSHIYRSVSFILSLFYA
jgi:glycosyltransferase involved in cell wall biosynthesis